MNLPSEPAIALLGISPREKKNYFYAEICTGRFVAALFVIAQNRNLPKCPSMVSGLTNCGPSMLGHTPHQSN